jgi:hypothetical protein
MEAAKMIAFIQQFERVAFAIWLVLTVFTVAFAVCYAIIKANKL